MSAMSDAQRGAYELIGPTVDGFHVGTATPTGTSAQSLDTGVSTGGCWITFQARGADVYIRFGAAVSTLTTSGNGSNGLKLTDGQPSPPQWVTAERRYIDHIASTNGTLFWWKSSPNYRNRP